VLAYLRTAPRVGPDSEGGDVRFVAVNFTTGPQQISLPPGEWLIEVTTGLRPEREKVARHLDLGGDEAVILQPVSGATQ
jgi:hypothetical protein